MLEIHSYTVIRIEVTRTARPVEAPQPWYKLENDPIFFTAWDMLSGALAGADCCIRVFIVSNG